MHRIIKQILNCVLSPAVPSLYILLNMHPGVEEADDVLEAGVHHQVVVVPGKIFWARRGQRDATDAACPYFRVSFVCVPDPQLREGFRRLRLAIDTCASKVSDGQKPAATAGDADMMANGNNVAVVANGDVPVSSSVGHTGGVDGGNVDIRVTPQQQSQLAHEKSDKTGTEGLMTTNMSKDGNGVETADMVGMAARGQDDNATKALYSKGHHAGSASGSTAPGVVVVDASPGEGLSDAGAEHTNALTRQKSEGLNCERSEGWVGHVSVSSLGFSNEVADGVPGQQ